MIVFFRYLRSHIEDHLPTPRYDLITFLLESELDGGSSTRSRLLERSGCC